MLLHIGENDSVFLDSIIGIFDIESTTTTNITKNFINAAEKKGEILINSEGMPKTFVLTNDGGIDSLYISSVNVSTLKKRIDMLNNVKCDISKLEKCDVFFNSEED